MKCDNATELRDTLLVVTMGRLVETADIFSKHETDHACFSDGRAGHLV